MTRREFIRLVAGANAPALPALSSSSQIPLSPSPPAILDTVVGVKGAATDTRFTIQQLGQSILQDLPAPSLASTHQTAAIFNVKDFGADGRDRLYSNVVGGVGYTGGSANNLLSSPEDYTTWNKSNVTVIANVTSDPRGNRLADAIVENIGTNVSHSIAVTSASFPDGSTLRYDVEVKPAARAWVLIYVARGGDGFYRTFQLSGDGVMGSSLEYGGAVLTNSSIQRVANGFYRCMIEGTLNGDTTARVAVVLLQGDLLVYDQVNDPHQVYAGNPVVGVYLGQSRLYAVATYMGMAYIAGDNVYTGVALTGGSGSGARANIIVGLGQVLDVISYCPGDGYKVGDVLSCRAADIGGTGNGFTCQVATIGNDTAAIQAAIDSGAGQPVTVFFPAGTYNIFPSDSVGSHALIVRENNVTMIGASRYTTTIQAFVSGGRHPETSWDIPTLGSAGFVWRGSAFYLVQNRQNVEWHRMRITGMCKRHNKRYPLGGPDPQVISGGNRLGTYGDGDGWDESHHAIIRRNDYPNRGIRWIECELDSWKGEIIGGIGDTVQAIDNKTHWQFWIESCYIHDTHADGISFAGNTMILNNEIAWCSNGIEQGSSLCHNVIRGNHFHDHTHGITLVVGVDTGAANTSTGQQVVTNNFFERCYRNGVFIYQFQCNVMLDDNVFVDCGVEGSITGGAIVVSLLSGSQPYANIYVRRNTIYNHARRVTCGMGIGAGLYTGSTLKGIYIEDNKLALTPAAQAAGRAFTAPFSINMAPGTQVEFSRNDARVATSHVADTLAGGERHLYDNIWNQQSRFREVHYLSSSFDKTNNTLADVPSFVETQSDSYGVWFEALLLTKAPSGGVKVAVVSTGSVFAMSYDVEMWVNTTVDTASGRGTASGTPFASTAGITKIRISGFCSINWGGPGHIKLQFAQNTTNPAPSSILPGSWFKVRNS